MTFLDAVATPTGLAAVGAVVVGVFFALRLCASGGRSSGPRKEASLFIGDINEAFVDLPLLSRESLSHNTVRFTFGLPKPNQMLGLITGQHIYARLTDATGAAVQRPYTPTSPIDKMGSFDLVVKIYRPSAPQFPNGGRFSQLLDKVAIGQTVSFKPARCHIQYIQDGSFKCTPTGGPDKVPTFAAVNHVLLLAGGTGITPMFQVLQEIALHPRDDTKCTLIYSNRTEDDILLRKELDALKNDSKKRFNIVYTLTGRDVPPTWPHKTGRISADVLKSVMPAGVDMGKTVALICGPGAMVNESCKPALLALGFHENHIFVF